QSSQMAADRPDADLLRRLSHRAFRGDESSTLRSSRSRAGIGWWLSHRVLVDEIRAFLPRRVCGHDHRIGRGRDFVSRWLAFAGAVMARRISLGSHRRLRPGLARHSRGTFQHLHVFRQGYRGFVLIYLGTLDAAPFPLGSTYASWLAFLFRNRPG